ncbi:hypothetical protein V6N11_034599 [Hibiscus sabdariffa]|uniref:Clu domain-containing protein n=1 Tax=Hibiscus sabdariffa TaxID=183260 RepID=A0ABR2NDI4_9ROSI
MSHYRPKLGTFYEFFFLSHLTPPLQFIRRAAKRHVEEIATDDHLFSLEMSSSSIGDGHYGAPPGRNSDYSQEDYNEESAVAHVRRVLDIVACTTYFGPPATVKDQPNASKNTSVVQDKGGVVVSTDKESLSKSSSEDVPVDAGAMSQSRPRLGTFYEFFSLCYLTPPLQFIRRAAKRLVEKIATDDHLFSLEVKLCNGKLVHVEAYRKGFYSAGKQQILCHNLADLLRQLSRAFDNAYSDLMKAFSERNKFGNLPYGFRANTWLVPPIAARSPSNFPPLPTEDETWGGSGGGLGRDGKSDLIPWANEFSFLASMPCKTADERQIRDRKAFLLHSLFVDVAILRAIKSVKYVMEKRNPSCSIKNIETLYTERVEDLNITVMKDASNASCKVDTKIDDVTCQLQDISTLGVVNVRYCGYIAIVKVEGRQNEKSSLPSQSIELEQPEGGANALNINSLRLLLHKTIPSELNKPASPPRVSEHEEPYSKFSVEGLLKGSLAKLEEEELKQEPFMRWELGVRWVQHLKDQKNTEKDKKTSKEKPKNEMKVEGLGTPLRSLKNKKKTDGNVGYGNSNSHPGAVEKVTSASMESPLQTNSRDEELELKSKLSVETFTRLKESDTGLHCKSLKELIVLSQKYYTEVALPKLVADFGSLELSPVDGRTLTDFMHTRGLQMRSLGHVVKLSEKLSHVQSLCIHEMIVRVFKHIVQAVIATVDNTDKMAESIASALNLLLGVPDNGELHKSCKIHSLVWKWLQVFLKKRYEWDISNLDFNEIRKFAILRGLCQKVGIELVPRDFNMDSPSPFQPSDVVSLVPVHKVNSNKGKLEDALTYGTKALSKLVAVCGPYHRMTAGAYNLLAVVLYHTGDFNQATIYQQKALDINERELGLDYPDTMKSYGDLAVFYYRLQHTELALKYVKHTLYLLHLTCGTSHPNTAATYINVAMMEEGMGNVHVALRYLHKALKCNQRSLGPDHIQNNAFYPVVSRQQQVIMPLSLMEAYPLSVQHEQTNLQILRAKVGPDDLRTQDAASWLEYFESKALEQQEAARHRTKKPDASIASKGHVSVSDLLDYIIPNHDAKGRDIAAGKRRSYVMKVKGKLHSESSEGSSKEAAKKDSDEEKRLSEQEDKSDANQKTSSLPLQPHAPVSEETTEAKLKIDNHIHSESHDEGDDGWQPVQRPRASASLGRRRLKQRRATIGKVFSYQKKNVDSDVESPLVRAAHQNSRCYFLKKRTISHGAYTNQHTMKPSQGSKFGWGIIKTVTYRVKFTPSSKSSAEISGNGGELLSSSGGSASTFAPDDLRPTKNSIISLGKSPSYKEVALAPPGSISKLHMRPESDFPDNPDLNVENHQEEISKMEDNFDQLTTWTENVFEENNEDALLDSIDGSKEEVDVDVAAIRETKTPAVMEDKSSMIVSERVERQELEAGGDEAHEVVQDGTLINGMPSSIDSPEKEFCEKDLSTSFEPPQCFKLHITRVYTALPPGPGPVPAIAPWPVNMPSHPASPVFQNPICSSSHHPYPSPPPTPNMMQSLPFMYPSYTQPQPVPTTTFLVTSSAFHPSQFSWQYNVNHSELEFIPGAVWPGHPMDFSISSWIVEPITDQILESKIQGDDSNPSSASMLVVDIDNVGEANKEVNISAPEAINNANEVASSGLETLHERDHLNQCILDNSGNKPSQYNNPNKNTGGSAERKSDDERTFSILVRGGRKRKHKLRMPISLLSRPYGSKSFKVIYNRVIRGSEAPKSTGLYTSDNCPANVP